MRLDRIPCTLAIASLLLSALTGATASDWLLDSAPFKASVTETEQDLVLDNGLIRRVIRLRPGVATIGFDQRTTSEAILRAVRPEGRVTIGGQDIALGGLRGQPNHAYLTEEWLATLENDPDALQYQSHRVGETVAPFPWKRVRRAEDRPWPPPGKHVAIVLTPPESAAQLRGLTVTLHYEIYDGIPLLAKWVEIANESPTPHRLERFTSEILAAVEHESTVEPSSSRPPQVLHIESDYCFGGMDRNSSDVTTHWIPDPEYLTQVNYQRQTECLLEVRPPVGPNVTIPPGDRFQTFRTFLLAHDSSDRERRGLAVRRMYRTIAPWCTENPLMMHVRHADPETVDRAIEQCAEVGFEMIVLTFGSGFDIENESPENIRRWRETVARAADRGVELGGYTLLSSRKIGPKTDVIDRSTGKPGGAKFGNAPCLGSEWGRNYFRKLYRFIEATDFRLIEHDGSYPGDFCASTTHPGHDGHADSQWRQWETIRDFYRWCRGRGVYLNVPDFYFLNGSSKTGMGYRETNWSLPRAQQLVHARQNIYDGTWQKTPSMGWMFVPLTEYHGGGPAATLEPLRDHLADYEAHLAVNLGSGVQACWRGPRLYDSPETRELVTKWVSFFKRHRAILESDVVHLRRPDGRDWDGLLHVNPQLPTRALGVLHNPTSATIERTVQLPLYYAGLTDRASIRIGEEGEPQSIALDREYRAEIEVTIPAGRWVVVMVEAP